MRPEEHEVRPKGRKSIRKINPLNITNDEKQKDNRAADQFFSSLLGLHTIAVYSCAVELSPWLVGRWSAWVAPSLGISTLTPAGDLYLQHLELATILPALIAGYLAARRPISVAVWAWCAPAAVLAYKMLQYHGPSSVLIPTSSSAFKYFFGIQPVMPTMLNLTATDPVRVLAQMTITAPFYAGVAYSLGALASKRNLLTKFFPPRVSGVSTT